MDQYLLPRFRGGQG